MIDVVRAYVRWLWATDKFLTIWSLSALAYVPWLVTDLTGSWFTAACLLGWVVNRLHVHWLRALNRVTTEQLVASQGFLRVQTARRKDGDAS